MLESPDYYIIRVFQQAHGWIDSKPFQAKDALQRFTNIRALPQNYRACLYAARVINDEERLANVSAAHLSALVQLNAGQ